MTDVLSAADLIAVFDKVWDALEREKDELSRLDGEIGDGDHGVTMSIGFTAVKEALAAMDPAESTPTSVFNQAAKSFLAAVGGSAGPLYATAFMRAGAVVKGRDGIDADAMRKAVEAMAQGIKDRGKADNGEKTMLDAWVPAADAALAASDGSLHGVLKAAAEAARAGADATRDMKATKGRSSRLGDRSIGFCDPGAVSTAVILEAMCEAVA
ncbi:MAG: dihydroxyacetone kinase subunit L [Rhodospirillales bacterium]|nr:dihydroxyacetone kinase subunit L [Rhodospirillales bacterium]